MKKKNENEFNFVVHTVNKLNTLHSDISCLRITEETKSFSKNMQEICC